LQLEEIRTKKGRHTIFLNFEDFINHGGRAEKLMRWEGVKEDNAIQRIKYCSHLQLSTGHVIPIIKLTRMFGKITVATPFGKYMIHRSKSRLPSWVYDFEISMRKFVDLIVDTRNFFFSFMVAFPYEYKDFEGDPIKILHWSYKNNILYPGFFKELRGRMDEQEIIDMIGFNLPVEKARKAVEEILDDPTIDAKVRGDIAMKTLQEWNKLKQEMREELRRKRNPDNLKPIQINPFAQKVITDDSSEMPS